ncbi:hypothetical protein IIE26_26830 (plasmid) [Cytobacillus oceanisediminis]|uniref:hypothetical protein n=1 Tax=Cytobacillus oceanisediminis TaxID=665099 RepID=UPI001863A3F8|nr:hypothetical protein [Cytobacillus oceanisediminis]QOK29985.1 hypothetical protein IIE26_26830 [Cytobacillus oceanisediminis]
MTRIPEKDRDILEKAMYLPMLLTILERDRMVFEKGGFKLKEPYLQLLEETIKAVQRDLKDTKSVMRKGQMRVEQVAKDEDFTMFLFIYKGFEERHNYFNPRIRNKVQELLGHYLFRRFL